MPEQHDETAPTLLLRLDEEKFGEVRARLAGTWSAPGATNSLCVTLMAAWELGEKEPVTASHVATFAEMASAVERVAVAALVETGRHSVETAREAMVRATERLARIDADLRTPPAFTDGGEQS